jgi:hypothetical protein
MRWWLGAVLVLGAAAFFAGRASVGRRAAPSSAFNAGYFAGREAAFGGFDGGWAYGTAYAIVLERGGHGITYRVAHRAPLAPGVSYRVCGQSVCAEPAR